MFANRFTALIDSCSIVGALGRNTLLSLAEIELYRARWSGEILYETEVALVKILENQGKKLPQKIAKEQISRIEKAFPEGLVENFDSIQESLQGCSIPDQDDIHVLAAAIKCRASIIVTENIKHFPVELLAAWNLEAITSDEFIANTIDLSQQKAIAAISQMRIRFKRPELSGEELLLLYERRGFLQTADILRDNVVNL